MSWFDKAKDVVSKGLDEAQEGIDKGVKNAVESFEKSVEARQENMAEAAKERKERKRVFRERYNMFNATMSSPAIEADLDNKLWRYPGNKKEIYDFTDIVNYELIQDGDSLTSGGLGIGRAIVGGAMTGGVGALLGGLTKKKKTSSITRNLQIKITNSADSNPTTFITLIEKKTKHKSKTYRKAMKSAHEILGVLDIISAEAEKMTNNPPIKENADNNLDQIRQLKELLDEGIITQEDFDRKKDELL